MSIQLLTPELIAKIAAGEVVESPASVVKELVENSIDAGAKNIKIDIKESGFKEIAVFDDGHGMTREDLEKSILLHATSKISKMDDLWKIVTLGFRGEALASISSVSDFKLNSKITQSDYGFQLEKVFGSENKLEEVAMNTGTIIKVANLFSKTPARLRFIKSKSYEFRKIVQVVTNMALMFPGVSFSLTHNDKEVLRFLVNDNFEQRVKKVWGRDCFDQLLPLSAETSYAKIKGYIGRPQLAGKTSARQHIFVNNRAVKNGVLARTVKDSYQTLLAPREQPAFMFFLDLPPQSLDVNIHPRKEEVKILNQREILNGLREAITETLESSDLTYHLGNFGDELTDYDQNSAKILKQKSNLWTVKEKDYSQAEIIQLHNTYLIVETDEGIMMIDQHAAHERILFEEIKEVYNSIDHKVFELDEALSFELPAKESDFLVDNLQEFIRLGFIIEEFGQNIFKLTAVPEFFKDRDLLKLLREVLDDISMDRKPLELDYKTERTIAYLSCRSAIKAGDYLEMDERRRLLEKLQKTNTHYTCPHGRPSQVEISKNELEAMFKRR